MIGVCAFSVFIIVFTHTMILGTAVVLGMVVVRMMLAAFPNYCVTSLSPFPLSYSRPIAVFVPAVCGD